VTTTTDAGLRHDWTLEEIEAIYAAPLSDLIFRAQQAQRAYHRTDQVRAAAQHQDRRLPEDCAYCPGQRTIPLT
jgi:biotin synthase